MMHVACSTPQELSGGQQHLGARKHLGSAGFWRTIHLAALRYSICAEEAVQEDRSQFCHQVPVDGGLGHAVDGTHSCGLRLRILHDLSDRLPDVLEELDGYSLSGVY